MLAGQPCARRVHSHFDAAMVAQVLTVPLSASWLSSYRELQYSFTLLVPRVHPTSSLAPVDALMPLSRACAPAGTSVSVGTPVLSAMLSVVAPTAAAAVRDTV